MKVLTTCDACQIAVLYCEVDRLRKRLAQENIKVREELFSEVAKTTVYVQGSGAASGLSWLGFACAGSTTAKVFFVLTAGTSLTALTFFGIASYKAIIALKNAINNYKPLNIRKVFVIND